MATLALDATAKAVTAAKQLGDVTVLCTGASAKAAADEAAKIEGVSKVLVAEDALYGHRLAEPVAALIASMAVELFAYRGTLPRPTPRTSCRALQPCWM